MLHRTLTVLSGAALALALLPGMAVADSRPAPTSFPLAQPEVRQPAAPGQVLVRQRANLVPRDASGAEPKWRIDRLTVDIEVRSSLFIDATVDLGAQDEVFGGADIQVMFGYVVGGGCSTSPTAIKVDSTDPHTTRHFLTGYTPSSWGPTPARPWECVVAATVDPSNSSARHHYLAGALVNTYEAPRLQVGTISVLGQRQKALKVAKGGWTPVEVTVANRGTRKVGRVAVTGKGRGLKVRPGSLGSVSDGAAHDALVMVKPIGRKKPGRLVLTARAAGGVVARRAVKVTQVRQPRRPVAGRYRGAGNSVSFAVRKGRITGFRVTTQTRCGGYGSVPTISQNTYDFPKVKVPRHGIVHATTKGRASGSPWSAHLQMRVAGKKVTRAQFRYHGPGGCSAVRNFSAKRVGR